MKALIPRKKRSKGEGLKQHKNETSRTWREKYSMGECKREGKFDKKAISNANMYQIFSYVKNMDTGNTGNVSGMLLYAKTGEEMSEPVDTYINGNRILVQTLDLNQEFMRICASLDSIVSLI